MVAREELGLGFLRLMGSFDGGSRGGGGVEESIHAPATDNPVATQETGWFGRSTGLWSGLLTKIIVFFFPFFWLC